MSCTMMRTTKYIQPVLLLEEWPENEKWRLTILSQDKNILSLEQLHTEQHKDTDIV